jgi:cobalt-precorrin-5B (C1)-methyltransferase
MYAKSLGFSTGACAAAAAKAAAMISYNLDVPRFLDIQFPDGLYRSMPVAWTRVASNGWEAGVVKYSGAETTDISNGVTVIVNIKKSSKWIFEAGDGVGVVTKVGLQIPVGEPAINNGPRTMIRTNLADLGWNGARIKVSIPDGTSLALRTFNARLGVIGGLSILGTTGRVRPFNIEAIRTTIKYAMDIIIADGDNFLAMAPGNLGEQAIRNHFFKVPTVIVSNEWGYALDQATAKGFKSLLLVGHPGKLTKLAENQFDTHSARSSSPLPHVTNIASAISGYPIIGIPTVEGVFQVLAKDKQKILAELLAKNIAQSVQYRTNIPCAVVLTDMNSGIYGSCLANTPWC